MNPGQKRPEKKDQDLINERIRFPQVLVIGPNGDKIGTMSSREAQEKANQYDLDLVCLNPNGQPPVCKILDYGKYRFEKQKKAKESKKNQKIIEIKEVQLSPQIGEHDLNTKLKHATGFLQEGNKVKISLRFKGRQMAHQELGFDVVNKFIELLSEYSTVEKQPSMDGRSIFATLASKVKK